MYLSHKQQQQKRASSVNNPIAQILCHLAQWQTASAHARAPLCFEKHWTHYTHTIACAKRAQHIIVEQRHTHTQRNGNLVVFYFLLCSVRCVFACNTSAEHKSGVDRLEAMSGTILSETNCAGEQRNRFCTQRAVARQARCSHCARLCVVFLLVFTAMLCTVFFFCVWPSQQHRRRTHWELSIEHCVITRLYRPCACNVDWLMRLAVLLDPLARFHFFWGHI